MIHSTTIVVSSFSRLRDIIVWKSSATSYFCFMFVYLFSHSMMENALIKMRKECQKVNVLSPQVINGTSTTRDDTQPTNGSQHDTLKLDCLGPGQCINHVHHRNSKVGLLLSTSIIITEVKSSPNGTMKLMASISSEVSRHIIWRV